MTALPNAFVIMPFDPEFTSIYSQLIKPALEEAGYSVFRADSFVDQQNIFRDIVRGISEASLVVAEITTLNPNVLYELGICHGLGIPTIQIAQSLDEVPFDLRPYRMILYSTRFDKVEELKSALMEIGSRHLRKEIAFGSPVSDFLPRNLIFGLRHSGEDDDDERSELATAQEEILDEGGYLDFFLGGISSAEEMNRYVTTFAAETKEIGNKINNHTASITEAAKNTGPGSALRFHQIASLAASDMIEYSDNMNQLLPGYEKSIRAFEDYYSGYLNWISPDSDEGREQVVQFRSSIDGSLSATSSALEGIRSFRASAIALRKVGISRDINRASLRISSTLETLIGLLEQIEAIFTRYLVILDEKLATSGSTE